MDYTFSVDYRFSLLTTEDAFAPGNDCLSGVLTATDGRPSRVLVVIDEAVASAHTGLERRIARWFAAHEADQVQLAAEPLRVASGEAAKRDLGVVEQVLHAVAEHRICRHSYILAIGGGAVLDAVGLAASLAHRGIRLVRMPTTVLGQNDAGLGVKNGINAFGAKNFIGSFAVPHAIVNDRAFLATLNDREWRAGIAEAVKVAIIKDRSFLAWIAGHADALARRDAKAMDQLIDRCAALHLTHITTCGDPFERGSSRPLDFGHWAAHRLEVLSHHRLNHGEAVAIGIALDLLYAADCGDISAEEAEAVIETLERCGFQLWDEALDLRDADGRRSVLAGLAQFREHLGGALTLAMPAGLGAQHDIHDYDESRFESCARRLRRISCRLS
ncbi:MAG: 3-dehydroquinate synthase [Planctomycetota bacterium]|jgi:3-dehydroquinate synthase